MSAPQLAGYIPITRRITVAAVGSTAVQAFVPLDPPQRVARVRIRNLGGGPELRVSWSEAAFAAGQYLTILSTDPAFSEPIELLPQYGSGADPAVAPDVPHGPVAAGPMQTGFWAISSAAAFTAEVTFFLARG